MTVLPEQPTPPEVCVRCDRTDMAVSYVAGDERFCPTCWHTRVEPTLQPTATRPHRGRR